MSTSLWKGRRWLAVALAAFAGGAIAWFAANRRTPSYLASASVNIGRDAKLDAQTRLLESVAVHRRAQLRVAGESVPADIAVLLKPSEQSRSIEIQARAADPKLAADYSNALADAYLDFHAEAFARTAAAYTRELASMHADFTASEKKLAVLRKRMGLAAGGDATAVAESKLLDLRTDMIRSESEVRVWRAEFDWAQGAAKRRRAAIALKKADKRTKTLQAAYQQQSKLVAQYSRLAVGFENMRREVGRRGTGDVATLQATPAAAQLPYVISRARVPLVPTGPSRVSSLALGMGTGALFGVFGLLASGRIRRRIEAARPAAANQPRSETAKDWEKPEWRDDATPPVPGPESGASSPIQTLVPSSPGEPKVIMVTSIGRGDGKSVATGNLAVAMANTGKRVVMIDADMRKPQLHLRFGTHNDRGLSELPSDPSQIRTMPLEALAQETAKAGLFIMPAGPGLVSMASLLHAGRMKELIDRYRAEFDAVVIEAPPLQYAADTGVLGRLADGAILVVPDTLASGDGVRAAHRLLANSGIRILGTVASEVPQPAPPPPAGPAGRAVASAAT